MWNDIFLYKNEKTLEKLAIAVMDMSSASESSTNQEDTSKILEFLTTISSIQIVNLYNDVDVYQLKYLKTAIESGKLGGIDQQSLQHLVLLVRDWVSFLGVTTWDPYERLIKVGGSNPPSWIFFFQFFLPKKS